MGRAYHETRETKKVTFLISRFNPERDHKPHVHAYTLSVSTGETVQDCLIRIKHQHDGSLTFRKSCRSSVCGTCGIKINGKAWLACNAQVFDYVDKKNELVVEPLFPENVIRDLVIDESNLWKQIKSVIPFIVPKPDEKERNHLMKPVKLRAFRKSNECVMCQCCDANCAKKFSPEKLGPAALNKGYRYVVDPRDAKRKERLQLYAKKGLFDKGHDTKKENNCPLDIRPGEKVKILKRMAKKK